MRARSTRLHALELSVKAPAKSRKKARALTVMRLEGAGVAGATTGTAAPPPAVQRAGGACTRLPKDVEDQIAIVRGRAVGKPSRGLLQLEQRLLRKGENGPAPPAIQRHDHGAVPAATPATPVSQARALSWSMAAAASQFDGRFNVESFEDTSATGVPGQIASMPANGNYAGATPTSGVTAPPAAQVTPAAETRPNNGTTARDHATRRSALTPDHEAIAASFDRDIAAMLGTPAETSTPENKQWDDAIRNAANPTTPAAPTQDAPAPGATTAPASTETPKQNGHDVFNQMGLAMNYANSFDLGAMDLSARFDRFEEELALGPKPSPPLSTASSSTGFRNPVQALALDEFDLVEDLAEIGSALSAEPDAPPTVPPVAAQPTPAPEAPKEPTATPQPVPSQEPVTATPQPAPSPEPPMAAPTPAPSQ